MKMISRAFLMSMLAIAGIGCGDDDGDDDDVDMFTPPVDMGPEVDMFEEEDDMGPEADMFVPTPTVNVRIAHLVPDAPNVRLCIAAPGLRPAIDPVPTVEDREDGVPFRAVGGYTTLPIADYEARVFAAETIDGTGDGDCSITEDPLLTINVDAGDLENGAYYTVAAIGFVNPADFQCPTAAPGVTTPCGDSSAARLAIYDDSDVDADNALIRVLHAIPNAPNVDICYDPDTSAGDMDPVELFENVAFGTATEYNVQDADLTAGSFRIYAHNPALGDCNDAVAAAELPIPTPVEIVAGFGPDGAGLPVVTDSYDTGSVHTIFAEGVFGVDAPDDGFAVFLPLIDLPTAP